MLGRQFCNSFIHEYMNVELQEYNMGERMYAFLVITFSLSISRIIVDLDQDKLHYYIIKTTSCKKGKRLICNKM